jgi:2-haloacid dehalogenase
VLDIPAISALTFDCYGTLVDWETGILTTVKEVLQRNGGQAPSGEELLRMYAEWEAWHESDKYLSYRDVLSLTLMAIARRCGVPELPAQDQNALTESLPRWPIFHDARSFLTSARFHYPHPPCICSNIDDDLWAATRNALAVSLGWVVTAQYCCSYKPNPRHFRVALALLDLQPHQVLHVAESRRHDIEPAKRLGFQTCWVNRHKSRPGPSASGEGDALPDIEVANLDELMSILKIKRQDRSN